MPVLPSSDELSVSSMIPLCPIRILREPEALAHRLPMRYLSSVYFLEEEDIATNLFLELFMDSV